jgi:hypothetical protein
MNAIMSYCDHSLCLIDEECDFFELEIKKSILFVHCVASKIIAKNHMPIGTKLLIKKLL